MQLTAWQCLKMVIKIKDKKEFSLGDTHLEVKLNKNIWIKEKNK